MQYDSAVGCELCNCTDVMHSSSTLARDVDYSINNDYNDSILGDKAASHVPEHTATSIRDMIHNVPCIYNDAVYCDKLTCHTHALDYSINRHSDINNNAQNYHTMQQLTSIMDNNDLYGITPNFTDTSKICIMNDDSNNNISQNTSIVSITDAQGNNNIYSDVPRYIYLDDSVNNDAHKIQRFARINKDYVKFNFIPYNQDDTEYEQFNNVLSQVLPTDSVYSSDDFSSITSSLESLNNFYCESSQGLSHDLNDTENIFEKILSKNSRNDSGIICTQGSSINFLENKDISIKDCYVDIENVCAKPFINFKKDIKNICHANDIYKKSYKYFVINDKDMDGKSVLNPVLDKNMLRNGLDSYKDLYMRCPEPIQNDIIITVSYLRSRQPAPNSTRNDASARNSAPNRPMNLYADNAPLSLQEDLFSRISHTNPPSNNIANDWLDRHTVPPIPTSTMSPGTYTSTNSFSNPPMSTRGQYVSPLGSSRNSSNVIPVYSPRDTIFTEDLRSPRNAHAQPPFSPTESFNYSRNSSMRNPNFFQHTPMNAFKSPVMSPRESYSQRRPSPPTNISGSNSGSFNHFSAPPHWRSELNQPQLFEFGDQNVSSFSSLSARNYSESSYSRSRGAISLNSPLEQYQNSCNVKSRRSSDRSSSNQLSPFSSECSSLRSEVGYSRENVAGTTFQLQTPRSDDGFASGGSLFNSPSTDRETEYDFGKSNRSWYDTSRSVERNELFEINRKKKMQAAVAQYNREKEKQRRKREAIASIVNRSPLYNWRDEFHLRSLRSQSDQNTQGVCVESANRDNNIWYDKKTWNSKQLAQGSTFNRRQSQELMSTSNNEFWANSRRNEQSRNKSRDPSPPAYLLPSDLFSESPPPSYQYENDNIDALQIEATATALSIVSLTEKIKTMTKKYQEVNSISVGSLQKFSLPDHDKSPDQEHNDRLPFKMIRDVLNSDSFESGTTIENSRYRPINESVAHFPLANSNSNIDCQFHKNEQRLDIPLQEELWRSRSSMTPVETSQFTSNTSVQTQDIQSPYDYSSADLLQFELFCTRYDLNDGYNNDSGLQDVNLIQPTLTDEQENVNANEDLYTELSGNNVESVNNNSNVDVSLSKLLPHWLSNDTVPKTESVEASADQSLVKKKKPQDIPLFLKAINDIKNRQEPSTVTRTNSDEIIWDSKEPFIRRNKKRYTQSKKIFRKLVNDIIIENESKVELKHKDSEVKANTNNDHDQLMKTNWRENSLLHHGIESSYENYDTIEFNRKKETTTDNLYGQVTRDRISLNYDGIIQIDTVSDEILFTEIEQNSDLVETTTEDENNPALLTSNDDSIQVEATKSNDPNSNKSKIDNTDGNKSTECIKKTVTRRQHKGKPVRNLNKSKKKKKTNMK